MRAEGLGSVCCVPLQTARCRHGTLNVAKPDEAGFPEEEVRLLEQVSQQLAVAIENAMHFEQAERYRRDAMAQRDRLRLLLDVNNALVSHARYAVAAALGARRHSRRAPARPTRASRSSTPRRARCDSKPLPTTTSAA